MPYFQFFLLLCYAAAAYPLSFEENRGQTNSTVRFFAPTSSANLLISERHLRFASPAGDLSLSFPGAAPLRWSPSEALPGATSYALPGRHIDNVHRYSRLTASNVYPGIDLTLYFRGKTLEYDFIVHPGADPRLIHLNFSEPVHAHHDGAFQLARNFLKFRQSPPLVYQGNTGIPSRWTETAPHTYRFEPGAYDPKATLILDPILEFASYLGGEADEEIVAMGDGWVAGHTSSHYFPAPEAPKRSTRDIFIRIVPQGLPQNTNNWLHRTFVFGGAGDDTLGFAQVSINANFVSAVFGGTTSSPDLPMTLPEGNKYHGGASDAFHATLQTSQGNPNNPNPFAFFGAYFGGSGEDRGVAAFNTGAGIVIGGTTDSPDLPVANAPQPKLAGGKDAFLAYLLNGRPQDAHFVTYLGGEGDDNALVLRPGFGVYFLAGETQSASFPLLPGERNGASDAFLFQFAVPPAAGGVIPIPEFRRGLRIGGSGSDRITTLARSNSYLALAGETTSPDLPLLQAAQQNPGGGVDAFYSLLALNTLEPQTTSYFGGSGDESLRALAIDFNHDFLLAGSTTSPDLPTREPLQSSLAGPSDAFFAYLGSGTYQIEAASYFGGSAADYFAAANLPAAAGLPIALAGGTTSSDLPTRNPLQAERIESSDAFWATISIPVFVAPEQIWTGPGVTVPVRIKPFQPIVGAALTAKIEDPSLAQIRAGDRRVSELTVPGGPGDLPLVIEGLAESGETALLLDIPGYPSRRVRVRLGRSVVTVNNLPTEIPLAAGPVTLRAVVQILDLATGTLAGAATPLAFDERSINWTTSDPKIFSIAAQFVGTYRLEPRALGQATLSVDSPYAFWPEGGQTISIVPTRLAAFSERNLISPLGDAFVSLVIPGFPITPDGYRFSGAIQFTSEDPSKLLISRGDNVFVPSFLRNFGDTPVRTLSIQVRALDSSGSARVRVSSPSLGGDAFLNFDLRRLTIAPKFADSSFTPTTSAVFPVNVSVPITASVNFEGAPAATANSAEIRPAVPLVVASSNPAVVAAPTAPWNISTPSILGLNLNAAAPGETMLAFSSASPHLMVLNGLRVESRVVAPAPFRPQSIVVGNKLVYAFSPQTAGISGPSGRIEISIADPTVALFSTQPNSPPVSSQSVDYSFGFGLWVHGVASSGSTTLRIRVPGREDSVFSIRAVPSGFAFVDETLSFETTAVPPFVSAVTYALDPDTLAPIARQPLGPGQAVALTFLSVSPGVTLQRPTCAYTTNAISETPCSTQVSWSGPGAYELSLSGVEGFATPRARVKLRLFVGRARLSNLPTEAVGDCLVQWQMRQALFNSPQVAFTITSLDPERLQFSLSPDSPPQASLERRTGESIFVHGLATEGFARYRIEGPAIETEERTVALVAPRMRIGDAFSPLPNPLVVLPGSDSRIIVSLVSATGSPTAGVRPGAPEIAFTFVNSNPAVLSVPAPAPFRVGQSQLGFDVKAVALGEALLSLRSNGVDSPAKRIVVRQPSFQPASYLAAKDARIRVSISVENFGGAIPTQALTLTARSLDPSRLLLAPTPAAPASSEINIPWLPNATAIDLHVDALASEGESSLEVSLPGYAPLQIPIYFTTAALGFDSQVPANLTVGSTFTLNVSALTVLRPELRAATYYSGVGFRPGLDPAQLRIPFSVDDPSVLEVLTPDAAFGNSSVVQLRFRVLKPGTAQIRLQTPPGFSALPESETLRRVEIRGTLIAVSCPPILGFDSQQQCDINNAPAGMSIRTSDPNKLLFFVPPLETPISNGPIPVPPGQTGTAFYILGLAKSGRSFLTLSAPGFADTTLAVEHRDSAFILRESLSPPSEIAARTGQSFIATLEFRAIGPDGKALDMTPQAVRVGAIPVTIAFSLDPPAFLNLETPSITLRPGQARAAVYMRGALPGRGTLRLSTPAGFAPPIPSSLALRIEP